MSDYGAYDDGPQRYRTTRLRRRERDDPDYIEETTFIERGKGPPPRDLVYRGRDRDDDVEDVQRDFPPPDGRRNRGYRNDDYYDQPPPRRARSVAGRRGYDDDDNYSQYGGAAAGGAAAGYAAGRRRDGRGDRDDRGYRQEERRDYYSEEEGSQAPRRERRKSGIEGMLETFGLGGVAGAFAGSKSNRGSPSRNGGSRSRSRGGGDDKKKTQRQWAQAAQAAVIAGAVEAFRSRAEPGTFYQGDKGKRILTAAISAGGIDRLIDSNPEEKSKRHIAEAVLGGLAATRLANGPRDGEDAQSNGRGRSRSRSVLDRFRSRSRAGSGSDDDDRGRGKEQFSGLKDLAAGGALAAVGKSIWDRVRSKSRGARRSPSASSDDSYVPSRTRNRDRDVGPYSQSRGPPNDENAVIGPQRGRGAGGGSERGGGSRGSSTDSLSSEEIEDRKAKTKKKEWITAGLASIATIHAAHGVYQSMEASEKRHKLVAEGEMSPEEARKKRSKAWLQDAAAIGIAALGIKGAYSEWKEMNEQRHSIKELEERRRKREKRREQRLREASKMGGGGGGGGRYDGGGGGGGRYGGGGGGGGGGGYGPAYPYNNGGIPPPPMGPSYGR